MFIVNYGQSRVSSFTFQFSYDAMWWERHNIRFFLINYTTYLKRHVSKAYSLQKLIRWFYIVCYNAEFVHQFVEFVSECIKESKKLAVAFCLFRKRVVPRAVHREFHSPLQRRHIVWPQVYILKIMPRR